MKASLTTILFLFLGPPIPAIAMATNNASLSYYPPQNTQINNLTSALTSTGTYGFIFNTSTTPSDIPYSTYNWCNMPHIRPSEYRLPQPLGRYKLIYVELIHRHHKRTPYAANSFPQEPSYPWDCSSEGERLFFYADDSSSSSSVAKTYQSIYTSPVNPFSPQGFQGTCQFPQITSDGLEDSRQHGEDLYSVYGPDSLGFLPGREEGEDEWRDQTRFRVTNNQITSQVAGALIGGMMYPSSSPEGEGAVPVLVQRPEIDSLEPTYTCPSGEDAYAALQDSERNQEWAEHLERSSGLFQTLDEISGVGDGDEEWHKSWDHYFDNLSARQCHGKRLPCSSSGSSFPSDDDGKEEKEKKCVTQEMADEVYRLGQWEYSHIYRGGGGGGEEEESYSSSLKAAAATMGVWIAELSAHFRDAVAAVEEGKEKEKKMVKWFHNVAHDGSVSRVLGLLQVDVMVWPGMGSEVVFELYSSREDEDEEGGEGGEQGEVGGNYYVRVLFGGQTLRSSNPSLGVMEMVPLEVLLGYFDGLVGRDAELVREECGV